jgi:hypothetical protein
MLDVHPPHAPTHTWKDFFLHIATITVGLLIAVSLEQAVEAVHHHHQIVELRDALHKEREDNRHRFARNTEYFRDESQRFQTNIAILVYVRDHPHSRLSDLPGAINWHTRSSSFDDAAWTTAQNSTTASLMPQEEVRTARRLYRQLDLIDRDVADRTSALRQARQYMALDSDPLHLSQTDLQRAIDATEAVLAWQYRLGSEMRNLNVDEPDFTPAPTTAELFDLMHEPHTPEILDRIFSNRDQVSPDVTKP